MRKLHYLLITGFLLVSLSLSAQDVNSAIGVRFGSPLSVSYKQFISDSDAIEVYAGYRSWSSYSFFNVAAAYQRYSNLNLAGELAPLNWYYGGGAAVNFWSYDFGPFFNDEDYSSVSIGLQGYLGLQYAFSGAPIEVTVDWVPTIFIGNSFVTGFGAGYGSLGVRYVLR